MYGTQTSVWSAPSRNWFENDVKMYGTQTAMGYEFQYVSLRMM